MKKLKPKADRASIGHVWSFDQLITCKTVDLLELACFRHQIDFDESDINGTLENLLAHLNHEVTALPEKNKILDLIDEAAEEGLTLDKEDALKILLKEA